MPFAARSFGRFQANSRTVGLTINVKTGCRCTKTSSVVTIRQLEQRAAERLYSPLRSGGYSSRLSPVAWYLSSNSATRP